MSDMIVLDYEKLKNCVSDRMPEEYLTGPIVKECYYDEPFNNYELNFNPYRRGGQLLPTEIKYCDKNDVVDSNGKTIKESYYAFPKGYDWLPIYFRAAEQYDEKHLLPIAFIAVFMKHFTNSYIKTRHKYASASFNVSELMKLSESELIANDYAAPDHRCKEFFDTQSDEAKDAGIYDLLRNLAKEDSTPTEETLADIIIKCVKFMTDNYRMEYWSYPESEHKRAVQTYKNAAYRAQGDLLRAAGVI